MRLSRPLTVIVVCALLSACAVSSKPEEQSSWDVVVGSSTGQYEELLSQMRQRLDVLTERSQGIEQTLLDYQGQLFAVKRELNKYELPENERKQLQAQIASLQQQTRSIEAMNRENQRLIKQREIEVEAKDTEKKQLANDIKAVEAQVTTVEKQTIAIEDGIKQIAAIRARQALEG